MTSQVKVGDTVRWVGGYRLLQEDMSIETGHIGWVIQADQGYGTERNIRVLHTSGEVSRWSYHTSFFNGKFWEVVDNV